MSCAVHSSPSAGCDHCASCGAPAGLAVNRPAPISGLEGPMMTRPRIVAFAKPAS